MNETWYLLLNGFTWPRPHDMPAVRIEVKDTRREMVPDTVPSYSIPAKRCILRALTVAMTYSLLRYAHLVGLMLLGGGLIGVWISDMRSRKVRDLVLFGEAIRNVAVFYDGLVVPGALILLISGAWMTAEVWGGWG